MDTTQNWDSQSYPLRIKARKCNSLRKNTDWLVVSTPLEKKIFVSCQLGLLFPIYGKIRHAPNHQPADTDHSL